MLRNEERMESHAVLSLGRLDICLIDKGKNNLLNADAKNKEVGRKLIPPTLHRYHKVKILLEWQNYNFFLTFIWKCTQYLRSLFETTFCMLQTGRS